jgi:cobalt/nickel transport system permease protein
LAKKNNGFLERTAIGAVSLLREAVSTEAIASRAGLLQRCDPRFKSLAAGLLFCSILVTKSSIELTAMYAATLFLSMLSSIKPGFFLKRTLFFIPIFSLFIVVPAIFNVVTPGEPIVTFKVFALNISITRQGVDSAVIFFLRVLAAVSLAILLVLTTRHHVLLKTLRVFRVPRLFVMTMGMCYRYIYLLLELIQNSFTAIKSRAGFVTLPKTGRRIVALNMAGLWLRSYRMHSQVYDAMVSRGYTGEPAVLDEFRAQKGDYIFLIASLFILIGTLWLNRFFH